MILPVLKLSFLVYLLLADEVTLLDMAETSSDDWLSSQNDQDEEIGSKKWSPMSMSNNPFTFYVCQVSGVKQDNFLRTPYVRTRGASFVYVDIEYKLNSCAQSRKEVERNNCAQSFHLHLKESENAGDLGRVDEYTYRLANDKIMAVVPDAFDTYVWKTVPVALSGDYPGVFFAIRDTGACIVIKNFLVKYRYCPDKVKDAVRYNATILDGEDSQVTGLCVENSTHPENEPPIKYCRYNPVGTWEDDFQKSNCYCDRGFALTNEICKECESGYYKKDTGNKEPCRNCPTNSVSLPGYTYKCECVEGFQRADEKNVDEACIEPPDPPSRDEIKVVDKDQFSISFEIPEARKGLEYKIKVSKKDGEQIYDVETKMLIKADQATIRDLEPDQSYVINFKVRNGSVESEPVVFYLSTESESNNLNLYIIIIVCLVGVVFLILIVGMIIICKRRKKQRKRKFAGFPDCRDPMLEHGKIGTLSTRSGSLQYRKYVPLSKYADPQDALRNARSLDYSSIALERVCGQGQFGDVWKGTYTLPACKPKDIAAKVLKDSSSMDQKREFLAEAAIMVQFEDPNVIELVGVVTRGEQFMIVTEYMKNGCLKAYLKEIMGKRSVVELLSMARGIVAGMKYLSEMNFIHRDLAARNILVDERGVCKVSDFGLSRILEEDSQYYKPLGGKIPVRWTAPEAIVHCKYTQKSDVYSMGVVLWEIFTWGAEPWGNVSNDVVLKYLKDRIKLPKPEGCPDVVYKIMLSCWQDDYTKRPTFLNLYNDFDKLIISSLDRNTSGFPNMMDQFNSSEECLLSVAQWLHGMGLSQYESHFMNTGWDTIDRVVLMEEEDLQKIGITLAGHQKKIKTAIDHMKAYTMSSHHNFASLTPDGSLPRYNTLPNHASSPCLPAPKFGTMT